MSHSLDSFALFAGGPYSNLEIGYIRGNVGAAGAFTPIAADTTTGFSIAASGSSDGIFSLTHPKCKFFMPLAARVRPTAIATVTEHRIVTFADDHDPKLGVLAFNTSEVHDGAASVLDPVDGSEIEMAFLYGFKE